MLETLRPLLIVSTTRWVLRFFLRLGIFGLFLMSALDSSFLVLPFGNDLLLIALVSSNRDSLIWIAYVIVSALGSVVGVFFVDLIMRKAGETGLERFISRKRIDKLKAKVENKAGVTVFVATLIPPPFPFTPAVMTASALQSPRGQLLLAVFLGRLLRFGIEAVLALYFGRQLIAFMNSDVVTYIVYALIGMAVILSTLSLLRWLKRK
ncbi:MAG TPA: VTT domain-containing protein [Pyrinomonadaceae bacterium]|nr:VTT domain-containing protein [Pyrinomonadaceae bacterium]